MKVPISVLVVDDERICRVTTERQLRDEGYVVEAVENAYVALERLADRAWDVVVTDLRMPTKSGLSLLEEVKEDYPATDVILITAHGTVETAVAAMRSGAADYLTKPFAFEELDARLRRLAELREVRHEATALRALLEGDCGRCGECGFVGHSPGMALVCDRIRTFAAHDAPVLVTGETGTGKEMVARALHSLGPRADKPFVPVGCGTIPQELAESELFGHEKGAFTGASQRHQGSFERASGGTLLLDDIDDLPLRVQVKLLRVLQEGTITRVGGRDEVHVDVRVVATSKTDLEELVRERRFRDDLFYRLRGLEITLPPLRERGDDVTLLANHSLQMLAVRDRVAEKTLSDEAMQAIRRYQWPGNVRELRRTLESATVLCDGGAIQLEHLPDHVRGRASKANGELFELHLDECETVSLKDLLGRFEQAVLDWALQNAQGQQSKAADLLGIPRTTFQSRLNRSRGE